MALLDILTQAQGGAFYANAGKAVGIPPDEARAALSALCPAIALKLRQSAENEETLDALLEIIEDGDGDAFLDDPTLIGDPEVAKDGNAILTDVYGTKTAALKEAKALAPGLDKKALGALTAIAEMDGVQKATYIRGSRALVKGDIKDGKDPFLRAVRVVGKAGHRYSRRLDIGSFKKGVLQGPFGVICLCCYGEVLAAVQCDATAEIERILAELQEVVASSLYAMGVSQ